MNARGREIVGGAFSGFLAIAGIIGFTELAGAATATSADSAMEASVISFVQTGFPHGVPYQEAHALGPKAIPSLKRFLDQDSLRESRPSIVTTIAFIGTRESVKLLRQFLWDRYEGEVDIYTFQALLVTPSVMGTIQDDDVVKQLASLANPKGWRAIRWRYGPSQGDALYLELSKSAINGLGYSQSVRSGTVLAELQKKPYSPGQMSNIEQAIRNHAEIQSKGFAAFIGARNR